MLSNAVQPRSSAVSGPRYIGPFEITADGSPVIITAIGEPIDLPTAQPATMRPVFDRSAFDSERFDTGTFAAVRS